MLVSFGVEIRSDSVFKHRVVDECRVVSMIVIYNTLSLFFPFDGRWLIMIIFALSLVLIEIDGVRYLDTFGTLQRDYHNL